MRMAPSTARKSRFCLRFGPWAGIRGDDIPSRAAVQGGDVGNVEQPAFPMGEMEVWEVRGLVGAGWNDGRGKE